MSELISLAGCKRKLTIKVRALDVDKNATSSLSFPAPIGISGNDHGGLEKTQRTASLCFPSLASLTLGACAGGGGGGGLGVLPSSPNRTPVAAADKTVILDEDAVDQALSITAPNDPDGNSLTITVTMAILSTTKV